MSGRSWELRVQKFNSKGFEYMLLDRQYFTDISDSRVAFSLDHPLKVKKDEKLFFFTMYHNSSICAKKKITIKIFCKTALWFGVRDQT